MRHQNQLVRRVKTDERAGSPRATEEPAKSRVRKHALDEVIAQPRIRQAAFFFHGQLGEALDEPGGEEPSAGSRRHAAAAVNLDARQAAAR